MRCRRKTGQFDRFQGTGDGQRDTGSSNPDTFRHPDEERPGLEDFILEAKKTNLLGNEEEAAARGAQLIGNYALHRMQAVTQTRRLSALLTTAELLEHIARWQARQ